MAVTPLYYLERFPLNKQLYIQDYCHITDNSVQLNGEKIVAANGLIAFNDFAKSVYKETAVNYPKFFKMDATSKLTFLTAEFILKQYSDKEKEQLGMLLSNKSASLDTDRQHQKTIENSENYFPSPGIFVYTLPNIGIGELSIRHKIHNESVFFVCSAFNAALLNSYATALIKEKKCTQVLCGWVDMEAEKYTSFMYIVGSKEGLPHTTENINQLYNNY